jgi:hypothetical protein
MGDETHTGSSSTQETFYVGEQEEQKDGIPGFPLEATMLGLAIGVSILRLLNKKHNTRIAALRRF